MATETQVTLNDRYAVREQIGSGGMASVYVADDLRLGRRVAVKVLAPEEAARAGAVERFRREAQAAASLTHPNVVAVYDWGAVDGTAFLVMEYVDGPDLKRVLRERGRLDEVEALRLAAEIAAALGVAHRAGIVHRDVKPRNVLLDAEGHAKLADFGIASGSDEIRDGTVVYGTALYISPEQVLAQAVDGRSDLYSLGVLLYEVLTGRPPFRGGTAATVADQHVHAQALPPRRLRPELSHRTEQLLLRALSKDPRQRFQSAEEMRQALLHAASALSEPRRDKVGDSSVNRWGWLTASPAELLDRVRGGSRSRVRRVFALCAVALAAIAVLLLSLSGGPHTAPALAGLPLDTARQAAANAGFTLDVEEQATTETPAGVVVTQSQNSSSSLHVVVSKGIIVPDLTGKRCPQARAELAAAGWSVRPVRWRIANIADFGKIVAQDPAPGGVVPRAGEITVQVAGPVGPC